MSDLRLAARLLRRRPGLSLAAIVSLALGIGAVTAIFTVLHRVVLNPLPFNEPERLVMVWETSADTDRRWVAPANFVDWRRDLRSFASLAAFDPFTVTLSGRAEPERLRALGASGTYFETLGARAAIGRALAPADDETGAPPVAVLSDALWQRLFGASPTALGGTLRLDGLTYTVVGVMPAAFEPPLQDGTDIYLSGDRGIPRSFPFNADPTSVRDSHLLFVVGRLAPGVSRDVAQAEVSATMDRLARIYPDTNEGLGANVVALHEQVVGDVRPLVLALQVAVAMMLLIACANVAHLLLGQATARQAEMGTRLALGASRWRLVRQLLGETLVLAVPGGALGLLLASWSLNALVAAAPAELPRLAEVTIDGTVLAMAFGTTLATAALFGLGPALHLAGRAPQGLSTATHRIAGARSSRRWHQGLVVTELALAQVLLVGAGLLLASFVASQRVDLGYQLDSRIAADLSLAPERYTVPDANGRVDITAKLQLADAVLARLRALPGVRAAAVSFTSPLAGAPNRGIRAEGQPEVPGGNQPTAAFQLATPDYFRTLGIPLRAGRVFTDADRTGGAPVAVVNETFAARYFPDGNAIGRRVFFGRDFAHEVVGIVGDTRYRAVEVEAEPTLYVPLTQNDERWPFLSFTVWADGDAAALAPALRAAIREADPAQAITRVRTFEDALAAQLAPRRFNTLLAGLLALVALVLAAVGAYGVMAWAVASRTREIGVRAALGARPADVLRLVGGQGARLVAVAIPLGLAGGLAASGFLADLLYGVPARDPRTFAGVAAVLALTALAATWIPARRAMRVNPLVALRDE